MARYRGRHAAAQPSARGSRGFRHGVQGAAVSAAAMAVLTASQAPGLGPVARASDTAGQERPGAAGGVGAAGGPGSRPGDGSYHTELPPLRTRDGGSSAPPGASAGPGQAAAGVPVTVLAAYRRAERAVADTDPGCRLRWELLAAIGKVESGQARGGAVDADGTTLRPILGPVLDGGAFAHIPDTDGGASDGDSRYDRAVGPMQFIPSTWARWGVDGNGDGRADPHNIHDAALAAGHYLCAGERDLSRKPDLERAILSYNRSRAYLRTVLSWYAYYRRGVHQVPDGTGELPGSPGAGNEDRPARRPRDGGGGRGPQIGERPGGQDAVRPTAPGDGPGSGSGGGPGGGDAGPDPSPSTDPGGTTPPEPSPTGGPDPSPTGTPPSPSPTECPTGGTGTPTSAPSSGPATPTGPGGDTSAPGTGEPGTGEPGTGKPGTEEPCPAPE